MMGKVQADRTWPMNLFYIISSFDHWQKFRFFFASVQNKQGYHIPFAVSLLNTALICRRRKHLDFVTVAKKNKRQTLWLAFTHMFTVPICVCPYTYVF